MALSVAPSIRLLRALKNRLLLHPLFFYILWPVLASIGTVFNLLESPYLSKKIIEFDPLTLVPALSIGILKLAPEFLAVGTLGWMMSASIFGSLEYFAPHNGRTGKITTPYLVALEPPLFFLALLLGVVLEYPSVLGHPFLRFLNDLSVLQATLLLGVTVLTVSAALGTWKGGFVGAIALSATMACVTLGAWRICRISVSQEAPPAASHLSLLLGIDSLSQFDDLAGFKRLSMEHGGVWYQRPVTPALYTNAVWASILMHRLPRETGIFTIFQSLNWRDAPFNLVRRAKEAGYATWVYFSMQITYYTCSEAGFDHVHSGPKGWLQVATVSLKNASIFLPVLLPHLSAIPFSRTPANQCGTFTYDLQKDIRSILISGSSHEKTLVMAHLAYLQESHYPSFRVLSPQERKAVLKAPVRSIKDQGLHWKYFHTPAEPLSIYRWKIRHLQRTIADELVQSGFFSREKGNRLALFSDHGIRHGLREENFGLPMYHRVMLTTFGLASRDPQKPISLLDLGEMLGFPDPSRPGPAEPVVENAVLSESELTDLMRGAALRPDGGVEFHPPTLRRIQKRLKGFRPYPIREAAYFPINAGRGN